MIMSFFGFDPTLPAHNQGHPTTAPGFGQARDPFASLSRNRPQQVDDEDDDDAYVGLNSVLVPVC